MIKLFPAFQFQSAFEICYSQLESFAFVQDVLKNASMINVIGKVLGTPCEILSERRKTPNNEII